MVSWNFIYWVLSIFLVIIVMLRWLKFVETKLNINFFEVVEEYFRKSNRPCLFFAVHTVAKLMTPEDEKRKQYQWIQKWKEADRKHHSIVQRDLYLLEERDLLCEQDLCQPLDLEDSRYLEAVEEELGTIRRRFWEATQDGIIVARRVPRGAWTREHFYTLDNKDEWWKKETRACKSRGGCCFRACQCCEKVRRGFGGQKARINPNWVMHCSTECGCCIRTRGFHKLPKEEGGYGETT